MKSTNSLIGLESGIMESVQELTSTGYGDGLETRWIGPPMAGRKGTPFWPGPTGLEAMVVSTKLRCPQLPPDMVERPRLLAALDQGLERPVTLLSAPAGYGKTTLLSHWLQTCETAHAWVSLEENENGFTPFLAYFLGALRSMFPSSMRRSLAFLNGNRLPSPKALSVALLNDLDDLDEQFVIVLDGVEVLKDRGVLDLLTALLRHPPANMNLVLAGRRDPFLPIASLRSVVQITEIRAKDLRFRADETLTLLQKGWPILARPQAASAWTEATEGWITGLKLALRETGGSLGLDLKGRALTRHVREYLSWEVLQPLSTEVRQLLLQMSVLDRICEPLCDFLNEGAGEEDLAPERRAGTLAWLLDQGMFLIPLDSDGRWFRLHGVVREFLKTRLEREGDSDAVTSIHSRASQWFAENGYLEDAVRHAVAVGDTADAEGLVTRNLQELMDAEDWERLRIILGHLPPERLEGRPDLLMARAWTTFHRGLHEEAKASLDRADTLLSTTERAHPDREAFEGEVHSLRSALYTARGDAQAAIQHGSQALRKLPEDRILQRGIALTNLSGAHWSLGDTAKAEEILESALSDMSCQTARSRSRILVFVCFFHWATGDLAALDRATARCMDHARECGFPQAAAATQLLRGLSSYQRNDLPSAEEQLLRARDGLLLLPAAQAQSIFHGLYLVYEAQGRHGDAEEIVTAVAEGDPHAFGTDFVESHLALRADLALRGGNRAEALELMGSLDQNSGQPQQLSVHPQLTLARILLGDEDPASLTEAAGVLDIFNKSGGSPYSASVRIEALCLEALLLQEKGQEEEAVERTSEALSLAAPGQFIRLFLDLGPGMARLLKVQARQGPHSDFVREILTAYYDHSMAFSCSDGGPRPSPSGTKGNPADTLTRKELETLRFLSQGLYNREIAERMFVTVETVKTHLKHIYQKLDVGTRRQAVTRAKALGLLLEA